MNNNKLFIIMIIFAVIFFVMNIFFWKKGNKSKEEIVTNTTINDNSSDNSVIKKTTDLNVKYKLLSEGLPVNNPNKLKYTNNKIKIVFDQNDAVIKEAFVSNIFLKKNKNKSQYKYNLIQGDDLNEAMRLKFGKWDNDITLKKLTGGDNLYSLNKMGNVYNFTCQFKQLPKDVKTGKNEEDTIIYDVSKKYTFFEHSNIFKMELMIKNNKNKKLSFDSSDYIFSIGWGPVLGVDSKNPTKKKSRKTNKLAFLKGKSTKNISLKKKDPFIMRPKEINDGWVANNGHYFAAAIFSADNTDYDYFFDYRDYENKNFYSGLSRKVGSDNITQINSTYYVYIGPKLASFIKSQDQFIDIDIKKTNFAKLENKYFFGLGNLLGVFLNFLNNIFRNYGVSIIILTLLIKLLLFPLTYKSLESQQKMTKLQPKIKELQAQYKDSPELLNKKTMELYKKEGINPLGGCLPMLLQMPILFAMYRLLNGMVQLKGSGFLWVKDLSMPDAVIQFPFNLLGISSLNILPIIMVLFQVLSSLLTPNTQSNQQAKIMMWSMPLLFFFLLYNVSSGLVLYWAVMNILTLAQQIIMNYMKNGKLRGV